MWYGDACVKDPPKISNSPPPPEEFFCCICPWIKLNIHPRDVDGMRDVTPLMSDTWQQESKIVQYVNIPRVPSILKINSNNWSERVDHQIVPENKYLFEEDVLRFAGRGYVVGEMALPTRCS